MKRIITETEETLSLCSVSDSSIVGIEWERGDRAMIISTREGFCALSNRHKPNIYNVWYADSTLEYIEKALTQGNNRKSKAFVFDTPFELYEWMSKYE
jgi:hypothetical protein